MKCFFTLSLVGDIDGMSHLSTICNCSQSKIFENPPGNVGGGLGGFASSLHVDGGWMIKLSNTSRKSLMWNRESTWSMVIELIKILLY